MDTTSPQQMNNVGTPEKGGAGGVVAIVIIIVLLVIGGWYFWNMKMSKNNTPSSENQAVKGPKINSSDLSNDLNASAGANIDAEMKDVNETLK